MIMAEDWLDAKLVSELDQVKKGEKKLKDAIENLSSDACCRLTKGKPLFWTEMLKRICGTVQQEATQRDIVLTNDLEIQEREE